MRSAEVVISGTGCMSFAKSKVHIFRGRYMYIEKFATGPWDGGGGVLINVNWRKYVKGER
jgi:hypothetical protein